MKNRALVRVCAVVSLVVLLAGCGDPSPVQTEATLPTEGSMVQAIPTSLTLGGAAPELTFTDAQGNVISLKELLKEKKLVVLNFWFVDCGWCRKEFPVMEVSYQRFRENVEILAVNPYDSREDIAAFREENGLSFPMVSCSEELALVFGINGYPTSVCIDRDGTISLIHSGAITDPSVFDKLFETYTSADYRSRVFNTVQEILN